MRVPSLILGLTLLGLAGCGGNKPPAPESGPGAGAMQALPVQVEIAAPRPISDTGTFVASIQSRDSMVVSPLVSGILRQILVRSGDHVAAGQPLFHIDDALQRAQVANLESSRAALQSTLQFDQTQLNRARQLYQEKIGTQQDFQQAESAFNTAKAQADSLDAQIAQAKTSLSYYQVTAPRAGVVGDIPVKVGDLVSTATPLTTLDSPSGLELYVQVPVEQSRQLRTGLPVEVLDAQGNALASAHIFFVSPQVDPQTQTILAKAVVPGSAGGRVRAMQYVQARITWGTHSGFEVPVLAVIRQGASSFLDLAAPRGSGYAVAQAPVTLGAIQGNDVEVVSGLKTGDKVIVSTHQILAEGMPVMPVPAGAAPPAGRGPAR